MRALLFTLLLVSESIFACSKLHGAGEDTPALSTEEKIQSAQHVFMAKVTNVVPGTSRIIDAVVTKSYRGNYIENKEYEFHKPGHGSCGTPLKLSVNDQLLIFISNEKSYITGSSTLLQDEINNQIKELLSTIQPVNQALKAQPPAAGTPQSGAP